MKIITEARIFYTHQAVVAHAFNPRTWEAEAGRFLSSRPAWFKEWIPGQPGPYRETLSRKTKQKKKECLIPWVLRALFLVWNRVSRRLSFPELATQPRTVLNLSPSRSPASTFPELATQPRTVLNLSPSRSPASTSQASALPLIYVTNIFKFWDSVSLKWP